MHYPIAMHKDKNSCFGVTVPDIPGCFSAGESVGEAMNNAKEAILSHLDFLAEDNRLPPKPSVIEKYKENPDFTGAMWDYVDIDISNPSKE